MQRLGAYLFSAFAFVSRLAQYWPWMLTETQTLRSSRPLQQGMLYPLNWIFKCQTEAWEKTLWSSWCSIPVYIIPQCTRWATHNILYVYVRPRVDPTPSPRQGDQDKVKPNSSTDRVNPSARPLPPHERMNTLVRSPPPSPPRQGEHPPHRMGWSSMLRTGGCGRYCLVTLMEGCFVY